MPPLRCVPVEDVAYHCEADHIEHVEAWYECERRRYQAAQYGPGHQVHVEVPAAYHDITSIMSSVSSRILISQ